MRSQNEDDLVTNESNELRPRNASIGVAVTAAIVVFVLIAAAIWYFS